MSTAPAPSPTPPAPTGTGTSIVNAVNTATNEINAYTPLTATAVLQVESVLANAPNQDKLSTALGLILVGARTGETIPVPAVSAISGLVDLIASLVSGFHASGLFAHKTKPVSATDTNTLQQGSTAPAVAPAIAQANIATSGPVLARPNAIPADPSLWEKLVHPNIAKQETAAHNAALAPAATS